jgi:hypothetical protein
MRREAGEFDRGEAYRDRVVRLGGVLEREGWRLKRFDISVDGHLSDEAFAPGVEMALSRLPRPAVSAVRAGVGALIRHLGRGAGGEDALYVVLMWWDNRNEMITRVFVRDDSGGAPGAWIAGDGRYSFCVWDLEVMWREREAYVRHVLSPERGADIEAYLTEGMSGA